MNKHILADFEIKELAEKENIIEPFIDHQVKDGVLSYGLGSYGIDIRIANEFEIFSNISSNEVDPKNFNKDSLVTKKTDDYVLIPPHSYVLGYSMEKFNMPNNVMGIVVGKSTYARAGIIANITPIEVSWKGFLTIEISNSSDLPARVYANEGIAQVIFFRGHRPDITYEDKKGKYQNQDKGVQTAKVA